MGWNIFPLCKYEIGISSLTHYFNKCELFAEGRIRFFYFIAKRLRINTLNEEAWRDLIFQPGMETVFEIGEFLAIEGLIFQYNGCKG